MHKYVLDVAVDGRSTKVILSMAPGESSRHVMMKFLALVLHLDRAPKVEFHVGQHYKPDLVCEAEGQIRLWIECGDVSVRKLDKVVTTNHAAQIVVVKPTLRALESYKKQADRRVRRPERIDYLTFEAGFVDRLAATIPSRASLSAEFDPQSLELKIVHQRSDFKSRVIWVRGTPE